MQSCDQTIGEAGGEENTNKAILEEGYIQDEPLSELFTSAL